MSLLLEDGQLVLLEDGTTLYLETVAVDPGVGLGRGAAPSHSTLGSVRLIPSTVESLDFEVFASYDPTGTPPFVAVTRNGSPDDDDTAWVAGAWVAEWGDDGWTPARTPRFGAEFPIAFNDSLTVWVKTSAGSESAVSKVGKVIVQ